MNNQIKMILTECFTEMLEHTIDKVRSMESGYLDAVEARNNAPCGSKAYTDAVALAESIESKASLLVFGNSLKSFSECLEEVDTMDGFWYISRNVFASSSINRPQAITKGTPAYRYRGAWVVLRFRIVNGEPTAWQLHVPEWVVTDHDTADTE